MAGDDRAQPLSVAGDPAAGRGTWGVVAGCPAAARRALSLDEPLPGGLEPRADEGHGPAAVSATKASAEEWARLLLTLSPAYRTAVVLRHVDGLSYPELAAALDRPEGTVKAQVHRGLAMLRAAMTGTELEELTA